MYAKNLIFAAAAAFALLSPPPAIPSLPKTERKTEARRAATSTAPSATWRPELTPDLGTGGGQPSLADRDIHISAGEIKGNTPRFK